MVSPSEARVESSWSTAVAGDEPSPHGVTLRFRVLPGDEVADHRVLSSRYTVDPPRARSCGVPSVSPAARRDTRGHPLLRLRPPPGCCPLLPPSVRRPAALSPGVWSPSALPDGGGYVQSLGGSHTSEYDPLSGFEPSQRLVPPSTSRPFSDRNAPGVSPFRGFPSHAGAAAHRRCIALSTLLPRLATLLLERRARWRAHRGA